MNLMILQVSFGPENLKERCWLIFFEKTHQPFVCFCVTCPAFCCPAFYFARENIFFFSHFYLVSKTVGHMWDGETVIFGAAAADFKNLCAVTMHFLLGNFGLDKPRLYRDRGEEQVGGGQHAAFFQPGTFLAARARAVKKGPHSTPRASF